MKLVSSDRVSSERTRGAMFYRILIVVLIGVPALVLLGVTIWWLSTSPVGVRILVVSAYVLFCVLLGAAILVGALVGGKIGQKLADHAGWGDSVFVHIAFCLLGMTSFFIGFIVLCYCVLLGVWFFIHAG